MKIGINALPIMANQRSGIGNYAYNVIRQLEKIDCENEYHLYCNSGSPLSFSFNNRRWHKHIRSGLAARKGTLLWLYIFGTKQMLRDAIDVLWVPFHVITSLPGQTKTVLTVHDLNWRWCPETMRRKDFIIGKLFSEKLIRKADRIITDAQFTAKYLQDELKISAEKLSVIPLAAGEQYRPHSKQESAKYIAQRYGTSERYILTVGTVEPRKNIESLLRSFALLIKRPGFDYQLLIAGMKAWKDSGIYVVFDKLNLTEHVRFLGYVPDEDMPKLYSGATAFVLPSLYEGFGLPPLEAMACGTPVVVSNRSSLPEVVGNSGCYVDPYNINDIAQGIYRVVTEGSLRQKLIASGLERAKEFSWHKTAEKTLRVFEELYSMKKVKKVEERL
jgi:glycosyltransferase involved in cell wall biosynthesis